MDAELDNVRTHTPPAGYSTGTIAENPLDTPKAPALIEATTNPVAQNDSAGTPASPTNPNRDSLFFNSAVPSYMPIPLRGSREVLVHQNIVADVEGLRRIQNDHQLRTMVYSGDLVALPASLALEIDPRLPLNRRYCRPWVAKFLSDLSRAHDSVFGRPLQLTSAVRTVNFQQHLAHYNGNAAPAYGDTASPHLTGEAIDLGKKGMSLHEIAWMREVLGHLQASGKLDVEEEFEQACFHISVYKTYAPRRNLPAEMVATNDGPPTKDASATTAARSVVRPVSEPTPVSYPIRRPARYRRAHSYYSRRARKAAVRRRRRHHRSMSLLAAGLR